MMVHCTEYTQQTHICVRDTNSDGFRTSVPITFVIFDSNTAKQRKAERNLSSKMCYHEIMHSIPMSFRGIL